MQVARHAVSLIVAGMLAMPLLLVDSKPVTAGDWCYDLWYQRNAIYARKGYCFKTQRARAVFGPACFPPYGQLSPNEQRRVNRIKAQERAQGCS